MQGWGHGVQEWQERGAGCKEMIGIAHSMHGWGAECYGRAGMDVRYCRWDVRCYGIVRMMCRIPWGGGNGVQHAIGFQGWCLRCCEVTGVQDAMGRQGWDAECFRVARMGCTMQCHGRECREGLCHDTSGAQLGSGVKDDVLHQVMVCLCPPQNPPRMGASGSRMELSPCRNCSLVRPCRDAARTGENPHLHTQPP